MKLNPIAAVFVLALLSNLCTNAANAEKADVTASKDNLSIRVCPHPTMLKITLESSTERLSIPEQLCGNASGGEAIGTYLSEPGSLTIVSGSFQLDASGVNLSLNAQRGDQNWQFKGEHLSIDGKRHALKPAAPGDVVVFAELSRFEPDAQAGDSPWLSIETKNVPANIILSELAKMPGVRIAGLAQATTCNQPLSLSFEPIDVPLLMDFVRSFSSCDFERLGALSYRAHPKRVLPALQSLQLAAEQARTAADAAKSQDDPAWTLLITRLEAIRTLTRPRNAADWPYVPSELSDLAQLYRERKMFAQAVSVRRDILSAVQRLDQWPDSSDVASSRALLGVALLRAGQVEEAKRLLDQAGSRLGLDQMEYSEQVDLLNAYRDLGRTDVTSVQLQRLLERFEVSADSPLGDNAEQALSLLDAATNTFVFPPPGLEDPTMRVFIKWIQSGVGNERLSTAFQQRGLEEFANGYYSGAATSLYMDIQVRALAGTAPDLAEIKSYQAIVASTLALGNYHVAAYALEMLIELDASLRGNTAVLKSGIIGDLQLIIFARDRLDQGLAPQSSIPAIIDSPDSILQSIEKNSNPSLNLTRPKPSMTPQLQRQLDTSIFSTATTAFATALAQGSSSTDAKRSTLLEAQALALLGLGKNAAADAAFAKALAEPQSVDHKAERSAWFSRVKADQLLLIALRTKKE